MKIFNSKWYYWK